MKILWRYENAEIIRFYVRYVMIVNTHTTEVVHLCLHTRYHVTWIFTHPILTNIDQLRSIELYKVAYLRMYRHKSEHFKQMHWYKYARELLLRTLTSFIHFTIFDNVVLNVVEIKHCRFTGIYFYFMLSYYVFQEHWFNSQYIFFKF